MTTASTVASLAPRTVMTIAAIDGVALGELGARRLREMGFDEGVDVELLHRGPIGGDPIAVRVGNTVVALRRHFAAAIAVAPRQVSALAIAAE